MVKVPGDKLVPHDGYYDLRITAELWEPITSIIIVDGDRPPGRDGDLQ